MKPTYSPKFISTIAALSLCASYLTAQASWQINNGGQSESKNKVTTVDHLQNGQRISTRDGTKGGTIDSLVIKKETNNDNTPSLEVGVARSPHKIIVPKITIDAGANLNRTIQNPSNTNNRWNIIIRGSSTINTFENNGTISSSNNADTLYLFTDKDNGNT
ncbi:MAG: hypothetical protein PUJ79_00735, partial [Helicobacter sp.]|nr:hypothetical protein [Helicobacter sp.]MDY5740757.1 hypothetical protein [Helicobacter sp.]